MTPPPKNLNRVTAIVIKWKIWNFQDLVYYWEPTTCISGIFLYRWPKVRSISWPPRYKSMGKTQMPQTLVRYVQIVQNHVHLGYCWWPRCNFAYVTPGKVIWGQIMTLWGQCAFFASNFWLEWDRELAWVLKCSPCPYASNDMQHNLVRSPFDLDQKMKLTFLGYRIYSSIRLDDTNTMVPILLLYIYKLKSYSWWKKFAQKSRKFSHFLALRVTIWSLATNWLK